MIDTQAISKQLQESGLSSSQADAIASMMGQMMQSELATKTQLDEKILIEEKKLNVVKIELEKEIKIVNTKVTGLEIKLHELEIRISDKMNSHLKWVAGFLVGQTALLFALI